MSEDDPTLDVARDLSEIVRLHGELFEQAVARADDKEFPGGAAMAMLGPVANLEAWANRRDTEERIWLDSMQWALAVLDDRWTEPALDDEDFEPPLQTLRFWTERERAIRGMEVDRPTLQTEVDLMRRLLNYLYETDPKFADMARDVHAVRVRMENLLSEGERTTHGVRCPKCRAAALVRTSRDRLHRMRCAGHGYLGICRYPKVHCGCADTGGLELEWTCPNPHCGEVYDEKRYKQAVTDDYVGHAEWLQGEYVEKRTGVKPGTVRVWLSRGEQIRTRKDERGRTVYRVADIEARRDRADVA